ncbi:MAG: NAD-dependent malic enzyme [Candidatus Diapherotrites archaeon CG10_big_fil_rev_8_21_14_0_10_31_34]|nr:MAG: NAD-dependent malic enzyme [Candidatus Diapherotrites archaeon CG10_big_fil_rev_8_21_14_0_10_31_34]
MEIEKQAIELHEKLKGKLEVKSKVKIDSKEMLALAYTPGVAEPCKEIQSQPDKVWKYTIKSDTIAVITDGSAVLGLGNIGAEASLPVMEGKCALFKELAGINAFPIAIKSQKTEEIVSVIKNISPVFGGINLEDISSPRCFGIERQLQNLGIPVMHDDQHATAIVVLAALQNALKVVGKEMKDLKIVLNGIGAAGTAITKILLAEEKPKEIILCDKQGILFKGKTDMIEHHKELAEITNEKKVQGNLSDALVGADVFIGVSAPNILSKKMIKSMNSKAIVFALANPIPEISREDALDAGVEVFASGRSDDLNQVNNVLVFPGVFKGALNAKAKRINEEMKLAAAKALASCIDKPTKEKFIPSPLDKEVVKKISKAVEKTAIKSGAVK